jgi:hypothetical protein
MSKQKEYSVKDIVTFGSAYLFIMFLLMFYPATVMMAYFGSTTEPGGMQRGFFAFAITWVIIAVLTVFAKDPNVNEDYRIGCWIILVLIYICFLPGLFSIMGQIENPTYPTYGTTDIPDYSSDPNPIDVHLLPDDSFTISLADIWSVIKGPLLVLVVVVPLSAIFGFGKKG